MLYLKQFRSAEQSNLNIYPTGDELITTGYPFPGGNKYRNLALQVGGVSKIGTIKCIPWDSDLKIATLAMPSKNLKLQTQLLVREGTPQTATV
jgi:hypothetical protein